MVIRIKKQFKQGGDVGMTKRFTHNGVVIVDHLKKDLIYIDGDENLLDLAEYVDRLQYENEELKQEIETLQGQIAHFDIGDDVE